MLNILRAKFSIVSINSTSYKRSDISTSLLLGTEASMFPLIPLPIKEAMVYCGREEMEEEVSINSTSYKRSDLKVMQIAVCSSYPVSINSTSYKRSDGSY